MVDSTLYNPYQLLPDGVFPQDDPAIPAEYDLTRILTGDLRSKEVWFEFAKAMSIALHDTFTVYRLGLQYSRNPEILSRVYKPMHLKMLGLDYRSDLMSDADYDRTSKDYSLYSQESKHRDAFVKFMGYMRGIRMDMVRLWTTDYHKFYSNYPKGQSVFDNPPGPWFPTTHVGLLYESMDGVEIDREELQRLFYKMAPIHLVMKWIGELETYIIGILKIGITALDSEYVRVIFEELLELFLVMTAMCLDYENWRTLLDRVPTPLDLSLHLGIRDVEADKATVGTSGSFVWKMTDDTNPNTWSFKRYSPAYYWTETGGLGFVDVNQPRRKTYDKVTSELCGWQFEPARVNSVQSSFSVTADPWILEGLNVEDTGVIGLDGNPIMTLVVKDAGELKQLLKKNHPQGAYTLQVLYRGLPPDVILDTYTDNNALVGPVTVPAPTVIALAAPGWYQLSVPVTFEAERILLTLKLYGNTEIQYVGLENGETATTPIKTDDCTLGYRAQETLSFGITTMSKQGFLYFQFKDDGTPDIDFLALEGLRWKTSLGFNDNDLVLSGNLNQVTGKEDVNSWLSMWQNNSWLVDLNNLGVRAQTQVVVTPAALTASLFGAIAPRTEFHGYLQVAAFSRVLIDEDNIRRLVKCP